MFVLESPVPERLMKALEMNYRTKRQRECVRTGGEVRSKGGLSWARQETSVEVLFPRLCANTADAQLAHLLSDQGPSLAAKVEATVGTECTPRSIIAHLISFGFEIPAGGGVPGMAARIQEIPARRPPDGILLEPVIETENSYRLEARTRDSFVGKVSVECGAGVAGIYDLRVESTFRSRGTGARLMEGALRWSYRRGLRTAVLAANPRAASLYARLGFGEVGRIWYSSLSQAAQSGKRMNSSQRRMVVAAYMGKLSELQELAKTESCGFTAPSGVTLMQVAAAKRRIRVGRWLLDKGVRMDPLSAWDLGRGARLTELYRDDPTAVNRKIAGMPPLHQAVLRRDTNVDNDLCLLRALLGVGADTSITDDEHNATARQWAQVFGDLAAEEILSSPK